MKMEEVVIITIGDRCWGKGLTLDEALANMVKEGGSSNRRHYVAFLAHKESYVDEVSGGISYPLAQGKPREIHRVGVKRPAASKETVK